MKLENLWISISLIAISTAASATTVFVESNEADHNALLSFDLNSSGALKERAAVSTSGKGVVDSSFALGPFDSDQEMIVNAEKTLLFAVNSGSNSIAVFHLLKDGTLSQIEGSPFDSHGSNPVSLGLKGNLLTVVNKHGDPAQASDTSLPNYANFEVNEKGQLKFIPGSVLEVANGSSPSQALESTFGNFIFGADFLGGLLQSFQISKLGQLERRSTLALPSEEFDKNPAPRLPLGLANHPKLPLIYVGYPTANKIGVYNYNHYGMLHFVKAVANSGTVVCWLVANPEGTRLYASNTGDTSVTVYDIASDPESPKELQKVNLKSDGGAYQLALSPDGSNLVVLTQRFQAKTPQGDGNEIHVLNVNSRTGLLVPSAAPATVLHLLGDARPQGVVVY